MLVCFNERVFFTPQRRCWFENQTCYLEVVSTYIHHTLLTKEMFSHCSALELPTPAPHPGKIKTDGSRLVPATPPSCICRCCPSASTSLPGKLLPILQGPVKSNLLSAALLIFPGRLAPPSSIECFNSPSFRPLLTNPREELVFPGGHEPLQNQGPSGGPASPGPGTQH